MWYNANCYCGPIKFSESEGSHGSESAEDSGQDCEGSDEVDYNPEELLAMGKKCLAAGDATGAVDHFQEACSIL